MVANNTGMVPLWVCKRCSMAGEAHPTNAHLCVDCVRVEDSRVSFYRQLNYNWMDVAKEADLEIYERQPGETDWEHTVWMHYRDAYPGKKPSYRATAEELNTSVNAIQKIASRWGFAARMQAWIKSVDDSVLAKRREQILSMNERHVTLAEKIASKLERAIDILDPLAMSPKDIQGLFKVMTDVERKARLDNSAAAGNTLDDNNPEVKKELTKTDDMAAIVAVLNKSGVLNNYGIKTTTVTEVVVKDD